MSDELEEEDAGAAEAEEAAEDDAAGEEGGTKKSLLARNKRLLIAVPAVLALGGGGYFAATEFDLFNSAPRPGNVTASTVYYDLPEMVVNLSSTGERAQYLKLKVALEAEDKQILRLLEPVLPRILDMFQLYLRELRGSDLEGSAGIFRLKEELLRRVNLEIHPGKVNRVLFKEIIVQ